MTLFAAQLTFWTIDLVHLYCMYLSAVDKRLDTAAQETRSCQYDP